MGKPLRIVYVGQVHPGGTCLQRMDSLKALGHDVIGIDSTEPVANGSVERFRRSLLWRAGYPVDVRRVNGRITGVISEFRPDIVWVDKGLTVERQTLEAVRASSPETLLVHFNPDDPFGRYGKAGWRTFLAALPLYDVHFVPRMVNVEEYRQHGARSVEFEVPSRGYDPETHYPRDPSSIKGSAPMADIGFIGSFEEERSRHLLRLAQAGIRVRIQGGWKSSLGHANLEVHHKGAYASAYAEALSSLKIALCFLRRGNRDLHTSRSIEIPACGTFMLAERTEEHLMLFDEGKEAEFFDSPEEMVDKARYYLRHESDRVRIARAGRERCLQSDYSYRKLMKRRIDLVLERHTGARK